MNRFFTSAQDSDGHRVCVSVCMSLQVFETLVSFFTLVKLFASSLDSDCAVIRIMYTVKQTESQDMRSRSGQ